MDVTDGNKIGVLAPEDIKIPSAKDLSKIQASPPVEKLLADRQFGAPVQRALVPDVPKHLMVLLSHTFTRSTHSWLSLAGLCDSARLWPSFLLPKSADE